MWEKKNKLQIQLAGLNSELETNSHGICINLPTQEKYQPTVYTHARILNLVLKSQNNSKFKDKEEMLERGMGIEILSPPCSYPQ